MAGARVKRVAAPFLLAGVACLLTVGPAEAAVSAQAAPDASAQVVLFLVDAVSYEELLAVPEFGRLARAGGATLMTTRAGPGDPDQAGYATLGNGTTDYGSVHQRLLERTIRASAVWPEGQPRNTCSVGRATINGVFANLGKIIAAGVPVCASFPPERADPAYPGGFRLNERRLLFVVGAYAHVDLAPAPDRRLIVIDFPDTRRFDVDPDDPSSPAADVARRRALRDAGHLLEEVLIRIPTKRTLVIVATPTPSRPMVRRGDEVTGLVMAAGIPGDLLSSPGSAGTLTSDTTRAEGLVANVDVAPTILDFLGLPIPSAMDGRPIEPAAGEAPFDLHRRHLEHRRIRYPVQMAELGMAAGLGVVGLPAVGAVLAGGSVPGLLAALLRVWILALVALPIPVAATGLLPSLSYPIVVPFVVGSVVLLVGAARRFQRWHPLGPFVFLGAAGLAFVALDLAFGGGLRFPLLGGTMFDGVRFYGLPNAFLGLLLASALFLALPLPPVIGVGLLWAAGLVAGHPSLGADIGGSVTLFVAAGVWWLLRAGRRVGPRQVALAIVVVVAGLAAVLVVNRYFGPPTHATAFIEGGGGGTGGGGPGGGGVGGAIEVLGDRLETGLRMLGDVPAGWIPVLGLPLVVGFVLARPGPLRRAFARVDLHWRELLITLGIAGVVSAVANDTGVAAVGLTFMYALTGMAYPAFLLVEPRTKAELELEPARERERELGRRP